MARRRLDDELVRRGLASDREDARNAVRSGDVTIGGAPAMNAGSLVAGEEAVVRASARRPYVSRGGEKLAAALDRFAIDASGRNALDAGASTGGFTDCLLRHGAARVLAVDVGYGDLAWSLRTDPRVFVRERTNVRDLALEALPFRPELVVADLSFISLRAVLPVLVAAAAERAELILLVKPQFEARKRDVGSGGVVRDPAVWREALASVAAACRRSGAEPFDAMSSPLLGRSGNVEFLLAARLQAQGDRRPPFGRDGDGRPSDDGAAGSISAIDAAIDEGRRMTGLAETRGNG